MTLQGRALARPSCSHGDAERESKDGHVPEHRKIAAEARRNTTKASSREAKEQA